MKPTDLPNVSSIRSLKRLFPSGAENATAFRTSSASLASRPVRNSARMNHSGNPARTNNCLLRRSKDFYQCHVEQHDWACSADHPWFSWHQNSFSLGIYDIFIIVRDSHVPPTPLNFMTSRPNWKAR
jgi:hypothetical protein